MITLDFVKLCMNTVLDNNSIVTVLSNSETTEISKFGRRTLPGTVTSDSKSVTWKTNTAVYFEEGDTTPTTVNCINSGAVSGNSFVSYYSMPLQGSVSLSEGNQIKVNPYAEKDGVHTRGISVKFSIPE